jgi:hypothetical protein
VGERHAFEPAPCSNTLDLLKRLQEEVRPQQDPLNENRFGRVARYGFEAR